MTSAAAIAPTWEERRAPPFAAVGIAIGVVVAVAGLEAGNTVVRIVSLVIAAACAYAGHRLEAARWIAAFSLDPEHVQVTLPDGRSESIPTGSLSRVVLRGQRLTFVASDGRVLEFPYVRGHRRATRVLGQIRPDLDVTREFDPLCPG